jgi:cytochrome c55X
MAEIKKRFLWISIWLSLLILQIFSLATLAAPIKQASTQPKQVLTEQRKQELNHLLLQDCGSCHGMTLKGGLGPALLPENLENKPTLFLVNTVLYVRPGTAMPPWQALLSEAEVTYLIHTLQQGINKD